MEKKTNLYNSWPEVEETLNELIEGGGGGGDLSNYYTKPEVDNKIGVLNTKINNNTTAIFTKQNKLDDETQLGVLSDSDTLSNVDITEDKNNKWPLVAVFDYIWKKIKDNKLITAITTAATDDEVASAKATKTYVDSKVKYVHTMVRYNEDAKEIVMGWWKYIDDKETATIQDFKNFLKNNGYISKKSAWYWAGGCAGTAGVRNAADTGTTYVGRPVSGVYYVEEEDSMYFKNDYNGQSTIVYSRVDLITEQI